MDPVHNICGLILAAGASKRMGAPKALLCFDNGKTLLARQVELLSNATCKEVIVVVGAHEDDIRAAHMGLNVCWTVNKQWQLGQFSSLQAGLKEAVKAGYDGTIVLPVDVVGVAPSTVEALIETALRNPHLMAIVPEHGERGGHPVYLSRQAFEKLIDLDPNDKDSRLDIQLERMEETMLLPVSDPNTVRNINTRDDWERIKD